MRSKNGGPGMPGEELYPGDVINHAASNHGSPATNASTGVKRKRGSEPKFYAVRLGRTPGVYHSWSDCLAQVTGFKNATFKSFTTLNDAEAFMRGQAASTSSGPPKFYAVANGRVPGIYTDWPSALKQITGWTKPLHRSFSSRAEAEAFVRGDIGKPKSDVETVDLTDPDAASDDSMSFPPAKKTHRGSDINGAVEALQLPGWDLLPQGAEDGFDDRITLDQTDQTIRYKTSAERDASKFRARVDPTADLLEIWTDGACRNNGRVGAIGGVGVYFGRNDSRNVSEPLQGQRQTNQRAELTAVKRALDLCPLNRPVKINTDSNYAIKCFTEWSKAWVANGWVNKAKKPVENRDLIEEVLNQVKERDMAKVRTTFNWVRGHGSDAGNIAADSLAVKGALVPRVNAIGSGDAAVVPWQVSHG